MSDIRLRLVPGPTLTARLQSGPSLIARFAPGIQGPQGEPGDEFSDAAIEFVIDGGGSVITTGTKGYLTCPFDATIVRAALYADQTGSIVMDVWKTTHALFDAGVTAPTVANSITAAAQPTITAGTKSSDATLTGWTTSLLEDDILAFVVNSVSSITRVTLTLDLTKV